MNIGEQFSTEIENCQQPQKSNRLWNFRGCRTAYATRI